MEARGAAPAPEEGVTNSSQEVYSSKYPTGGGEMLLFGRSLTPEASLGGGQQLGRTTIVKVQVLGVVKDGLS